MNNKLEHLTKREIEVIKLVSQGLENSEIAKELGISIHTVKANLEAIYYKLNAKNRIQAVIKSVQLNYIEI